MTRWMRGAGLPNCLLVPALLVGVTGCNQSNPGYQRASDVRKQGAPETTNSAQLSSIPPEVVEQKEVAESDAEPAAAVPELPPVSALAPINVVDGSSVGSLVSSGLEKSPVVASDSVAKNASESPPGTTDKAKESAPNRQIEVLIKDKTFRKDRRTGATMVTFEDLDLEKVLNMTEITEDANEIMPGWLKDLNGKNVRIRGFMRPAFVAEGIERFVLAKDNQACCFGPNPRIDYLSQVDLKEGTTTNYIPPERSFDVVGNFKIDVKAKEGRLYSLYIIEDARIIER